MSLSSTTDTENFHENQYNEIGSVKTDITQPNEAQDDAFKYVEDERNNKKKSIMFMLIKTLFESTIRKMELAVALPSLLLDPELFMILTPDEINVINDIFQCDNEVCFKYLPSQSASENRKSTANFETIGHIDTPRLDRAVCKVLKILEKYIDVLCTRPCYKSISIPSVLFLHHIRHLLEQHVLCRMSLTPEQARNKELHYRELWRCHKRSVEDIATFTSDLEGQRADHEAMLEDMIKRYKKNIITIDKIHNKCNQDVANIITKHERKQLALYKTWELEQKDVQLALENVVNDLESLKQMNRELEEDVRERKSAIESELLAIINKYNAEIGSRNRTLEELAEIYEYDKSKRRAMENEIKRQELAYVDFVKQKEEAEMTRFYERLNAFQRERAVKFIQRWWRKVVRRKKEIMRKAKEEEEKRKKETKRKVKKKRT